MSTAGNTPASAASRRSQSSEFAVSRISSKMSSSTGEPLSTTAVARMVSEPPSSRLRAAPKNRLGGYNAFASTPAASVRPLAGAVML